MKNYVTINQRKSGNYSLVGGGVEIKQCSSPQILWQEVTALSGDIILADYSRTQLKVKCFLFTKQQALKAFGIPATSINLQKFFVS